MGTEKVWREHVPAGDIIVGGEVAVRAALPWGERIERFDAWLRQWPVASAAADPRDRTGRRDDDGRLNPAKMTETWLERNKITWREKPEAHDQTFPLAAEAVYILGATNAKDTAMTEFAYDHVHLRSPDPEETARYYERMFGAEVIKSVQSDGRERVDMKLGGVMMFIAKVEPEQTLAAKPGNSYVGLDHLGLRVRDIDAVCRS